MHKAGRFGRSGETRVDTGAVTDASDSATPLLLQTFTADGSATLWDQAFPAETWRAVVGSAVLTVETDDENAVLMGAKGGRRQCLGPMDGGRRRVPLADLDHDWFWLEGPVRTVSWFADLAADLPPIVVVMPTYRRERAATLQAQRFSRMPMVSEVLVIDQGATLATHRPFTRVREAEDTVDLISQPNLGGSGGYARGMAEASRAPGAAVLFSDDDAVISEESLRRMLTYQALSARPTIVGAPLFSSSQPSRLIAHTESVRPGAFQWRAANGMRGVVDIADTSPTDWTFLTPRGRTNYTGWWATLFPPGTASELGLPAPFFLKWDDAEYGLRATTRGYEHAVLPGTSVHHPPWNAYRTQMSWSARVLHRNRLATAAAYGAGRGVILSSLIHQCKHILAGHLLTAALWHDGIVAFRAGPDAWLGNDLARARKDGTRVVTEWYEDNGTPTHLTANRAAPRPFLPALLHSAARLVRPDTGPRVVVTVSVGELHWRTTLGADAVIVTEDDGTPLTTFPVRGPTARRTLGRTLRAHADLLLHWPSLRRRYRTALPRHSTADSWSALFTAPPERESSERG